MGQAIGEMLPLAVGVAISPIPVIAVILMLLSDRARQNALAFMLGWVVGIVAAMTMLVALGSTQDLSTSGSTSGSAKNVAWIDLTLGLLLLIAAIRQWRKRPGPGEEARMPAWMSKIDGLKPAAALGLGLLLSAVNPKNLLLIAGGAVVVAKTDLGSTDTAIVIGVFTIIGACTVAIPTLAYLFMGPKVQPSLDRTKVWLSANNAAVMSVLLLVIGVSLLGKGIGVLI